MNSKLDECITNTIATPRNPDRIRIDKVTTNTIIKSLPSRSLNELCELSCKIDAPRIPQVKKHSRAAQIQDWKIQTSFYF